VRLHLIAGRRPTCDRRGCAQERAFCATPEAFFQTIARAAPRGHFPRGMSGEQSYWTVVASTERTEKASFFPRRRARARRAILDRALRVGDSGLLSWANVEIEHSSRKAICDTDSAVAARQVCRCASRRSPRARRETQTVLAQYELANEAPPTRNLTLALAVRPFQVNPPAQFPELPRGTSQISQHCWDDGAFAVNGQRSVFALRRTDELPPQL